MARSKSLLILKEALSRCDIGGMRAFLARGHSFDPWAEGNQRELLKAQRLSWALNSYGEILGFHRYLEQAAPLSKALQAPAGRGRTGNEGRTLWASLLLASAFCVEVSAALQKLKGSEDIWSDGAPQLLWSEAGNLLGRAKVGAGKVTFALPPVIAPDDPYGRLALCRQWLEALTPSGTRLGHPFTARDGTLTRHKLSLGWALSRDRAEPDAERPTALGEFERLRPEEVQAHLAGLVHVEGDPDPHTTYRLVGVQERLALLEWVDGVRRGNRRLAEFGKLRLTRREAAKRRERHEG